MDILAEYVYRCAEELVTHKVKKDKATMKNVCQKKNEI